MKVGVVGKGGTGKTTTSSLLAQAYAARGRRVLAVDTDSNPNLALSLGIEPAAVDSLPAIPRALVIGAGGSAMTPAEVVARYGVPTPSQVTLLHAMAITEAGGG